MSFRDWTSFESTGPAPMAPLDEVTGLAVVAGEFDIQIKRGIAFPGVILQCADENVTVTASEINPPVPDLSGTYVPCGTYNDQILYILPGEPATFLYYNTVATTYIIAQTLSDGGFADLFVPSPVLTDDPSGEYIGIGDYTGALEVEDHPVDLTGYTAEAVVKRNDTEEVILDLEPEITDPTIGEITIPLISSEDTSELPILSNGHWDLVLNDGSNRFGPYVSGLFIISDNVTQLDD